MIHHQTISAPFILEVNSPARTILTELRLRIMGMDPITTIPSKTQV